MFPSRHLMFCLFVLALQTVVYCTVNAQLPPNVPNVAESSASSLSLPDAIVRNARQKMMVKSWSIPKAPVDTSGGFLRKSLGLLVLAGQSSPAPGDSLTVWTLATASPMPADPQWKPTSVMVPRWTTATNWDSKIICVGGLVNGAPSDQVLLLEDKDGLTSRALPKLPSAVVGAGAAVVGTKLYVLGGASTVSPVLLTKNFWSLDLAFASAAWKAEAAFPGTARAFSATTEQYGMVGFFGGFTAAGNGSLESTREAWVYRPVPLEGTKHSGWNKFTNLPQPTARATALPLGQAHIMLVGGMHEANAAGLFAPSTQVAEDPWLFHVVTDAWVSFDQPVDMSASLAVKVDKNVVLVPSANAPETAAVRELSFPSSVRNLALLDWIVVGAYFVLIASIGFIFSRQESSEEFSLGNRKVKWWAAGISMFATGASAISFMAIPALAFSTNLVWLFPLVAAIPAYFVTAYLIFPLLRRMNITSTYEYLEHRFNRPLRMIASAQCILFQTFGRAAVVLVLPALAISVVTGINVYKSVLLMGILTTIYTALGGFEAVIWTEVFQGLLKLVAPLIMIGFAIHSLPGGFSEFLTTGSTYHKFDFAVVSWDLTVPAFWILMIGTFLNMTVTTAGDQPIIQRVFSSPLAEVRRVNMMSTACGIVIGTIVNVMGLAIFCYFRAHPEKFDPTAQNDQIVPLFTAQAMPVGFAGMVVAAIFASAMATVASAMNSVATIFTEDFFMRLKPAATDKTRLRVLKSTSYVVGFIGTAMALLLAGQNLKSMMVVWNQIAALLGGGIVGVYSLGMFTKRANGFGAIFGALSSMVITLLVKLYTSLHWGTYIPIAILSCVIIGYLASFLSSKHKPLDGLTIYTPANPES